MFELTASVLGGEPPVYDGASIVALAFECCDLPFQQRFIADPAVQALPAEDAQLDLGHVQPASVIGCVVKLQAFGYAARLGRCKRFVERAQLVGVEIVQTSRITVASEYASSTSHFIRCAKSTAVRCPVTSTCLHPPFGSQNMNRFRVPFRWYSVS